MTSTGPLSANSNSTPSGSRRFEALDGWRGLCALWIVFYHFRAVSHVYDWSWIRTGDIAVDFFFVLSGFVITHAYGGKLNTLNDRLQFLLRRLGRLYPLHLVTLTSVLILELGRLLVSRNAGMEIHSPAFSGDTSLTSLFLNFALVHAWGFLYNFTWNVPSWSISVEWALCILSALIFGWRQSLLWTAILAVGGFAAMVWMGTLPTFPFEGHSALVKGVYGFFLGAVVFRIHEKVENSPLLQKGNLELLSPLLLVAAVLCKENQIHFGPALLFAGLVLLFANQSGPISRLISTRPFVMVGEISYSIYLVHYVVVLIAFGVAAVLGSVFAYDPIVEIGPHRSSVINMPSLWFGDIMSVIFASFIVGISFISYNVIEKPGRNWFNAKARRLFSKSELQQS